MLINVSIWIVLIVEQDSPKGHHYYDERNVLKETRESIHIHNTYSLTDQLFSPHRVNVNSKSESDRVWIKAS